LARQARDPLEPACPGKPEHPRGGLDDHAGERRCAKAGSPWGSPLA
jgi:hypothetical protein